jgi:arginase
MFLLQPEWQGFGLHPGVFHGARALGAELFRGLDYTTIDAPETETLEVEDQVLGWHSIAARAERALEILREALPDRTVMVAGTCGAELAPVAYLNEQYAGDLAVLWLDAHADLNTPASSPSGHFHGMILRTLLGDGPAAAGRMITRPLAPSQVFLVGVREFDPPEAEFVKAHGIPVLGDDVFEDPARAVAVLGSRGIKRLYVHFDVDVLDPASFTGALMHAPGGGPTLAQATAFIGVMSKSFDVVGLSVLEYCEREPAAARALAGALVSSCYAWRASP